MSPPRSRAAGADIMELVLEKVTALERDVSATKDNVVATKEMLVTRLVAIENKIASTPGDLKDLEARVTALEQTRARAEGAAWAGRVVWGAIVVLAGAAGWLISALLHTH